MPRIRRPMTTMGRGEEQSTVVALARMPTAGRDFLPMRVADIMVPLGGTTLGLHSLSKRDKDEGPHDNKLIDNVHCQLAGSGCETKRDLMFTPNDLMYAGLRA